ncbi:tash protein pest motif family protein [Burkholderia pseudomallei]|nr:tash protein pest motif family protein [Burkholderia pseudomallei]
MRAGAARGRVHPAFARCRIARRAARRCADRVRAAARMVRPFDCRILVAGHLPFFAGYGAEAAVRACRISADAFAGDRGDRRRCASGPIGPATRSQPRGRFGCRACAEWFHMHPARVPMGSRWRRDYAAIALRLGIGGCLSPRLERRAAARRACARGFRGIDDSRPRTAENARAECQMPDAGTVGAKARSRRRFDSSAASRNAATASNTRRQRADDGGIASPARSRHPLPLVPRTHEKKPHRHFHRRGQPMSEKFHGGDGNDHIGRPAASQPSISAIQLRRARSRASGRRAYR